MKRVFVCLLVLVLFSSHDMYLKLDGYFLEPNSDAVIQLFNGTFENSDNVIKRDRMVDVSLVSKSQRIPIDSTNWFEKETTTYLNLKTGSAGTYLLGVSSKARDFVMSAEDFNDYLEHDGVLDMLELRTQNGTLGDSARERYSKHVKTIFQVGDDLTEDYQTELGYPIEFIPQENPYDLHAGHDLPVKLLFNQEPLPNQLVYVGYKSTNNEHSHSIGITHSHEGQEEHSHENTENADHTHDELLQLRTDEEGMINIPISSEGIWYLRTIHLVETNVDDLTHESNWTTLTFEVGSGHSEEHGHVHKEGIPDYIFILLSLVLIGGLFHFFNRKK